VKSCQRCSKRIQSVEFTSWFNKLSKREISRLGIAKSELIQCTRWKHDDLCKCCGQSIDIELPECPFCQCSVCTPCLRVSCAMGINAVVDRMKNNPPKFLCPACNVSLGKPGALAVFGGNKEVYLLLKMISLNQLGFSKRVLEVDVDSLRSCVLCCQTFNKDEIRPFAPPCEHKLVCKDCFQSHKDQGCLQSSLPCPYCPPPRANLPPRSPH
jgi:hypothetical protein